MNQQKIGQFLKELRKEKGVTQAQLAEMLNVTNRSVSRWENGVNMPDLDLLIQLSDYYSVDISEIIDGERKSDNMDKKTEETLLKAAEYTNNEKMIFSKRLSFIFAAGLIANIAYLIMDVTGMTQGERFDGLEGFLLGFVGGVLILGIVYNSRYMAKIRDFKMRLINRNK